MGTPTSIKEAFSDFVVPKCGLLVIDRGGVAVEVEFDDFRCSQVWVAGRR